METVLYDIANGVATITMNRPDALNSVDGTLGSELLKALQDAAGDAQVRCVVLTGAGKGFCAGADLGQFQEAFDAGVAPPMNEVLRERYHPLITSITEMAKPVVGGLNGVAAGMGTSLAMACDFRIASDKARFTQAFLKIAVVPDSGATHLLPQLVGVAKAKELAMLNPVLNADEMLRIGLVTEVVPHEQYPARLAEFAAALAKGPTLALGLTKKAINHGARQDLLSSMDYEADLQQQIAHSADMTEGIKAFLEKREANYTGR
ncbi:MAG TPA: enoyl-CoA hydratase-related protein [Actinomycetota bacterium]|nr:enoyl-CoA hydratase-related protein [Actinomycetota bacterium]